MPRKKGNKQESWTKEQSAIIVNMWKDLFQEIETYKQPSSWLKMKNKIDKKGLSTWLTQIKKNFVIWKTRTKRNKDNNSQIATSPMYPPFYNDFEELLGSRDVTNLKYVKEVEAGLSPAKTDDA